MGKGVLIILGWQLVLVWTFCTFSRIFAITGNTAICLKSLLIFSGGSTLGTGLTKVCLYMVGYLFCTILVVMISCGTMANSSAKRLNTQARILSAPVTFRAFSCFKTFLTCLMLGIRGLETERPPGSTSVVVGVKSCHGQVKASWSFSVRFSEDGTWFAFPPVTTWMVDRCEPFRRGSGAQICSLIFVEP